MTDPHPTKPQLQFVTRKWPPAIGGMETYSVHLVEHLGHRFDVDVIACAGQEDGSAPTA